MGFNMKQFHFTKKYFNKLSYDDVKSNIRIVVSEIPSLNVYEEDYSLRIETYHTGVHRKYAIEHHQNQEKHYYPHLQFKFYTEKIGSFWIRLDFKDSDEYERAILGFIYKIKLILSALEKIKKGITSEILILDLVNELESEGEFLSKKINESIERYNIEFKDKSFDVTKLKENKLILNFLGKNNVQKMISSNIKSYGK